MFLQIFVIFNITFVEYFKDHFHYSLNVLSLLQFNFSHAYLFIELYIYVFYIFPFLVGHTT